MTEKLRLAAATLTLVLGTAACGSASTTAHGTRSAPARQAPSGDTTASTTAAPPMAAGATRPLSGHAKVTIANYMFMPMHLVVRAGTRVSFHNTDQASHTATSEHSGFDTGTIAGGGTATVTLRRPGTYTYHCLFHAFMTATITVVAR